jgi:hypothetical protein
MYSGILTREEAKLEHLYRIRHLRLTEAIQHWPDFDFTAADGRSFCLAINGESVGHRIMALCNNTQLTQADWKWLCALSGAIVEGGDCPDYNVPPMIYRDAREAFEAWRDLHAASGVSLDDDTTKRLAEMLGVDLDEDGELFDGDEEAD